MAKLTKIQMNFIERMGLTVSDTFDATGLRTFEYKKKMKLFHKLIAYGVTPCEKSAHTLRGSHGHCVQCNPQVLSHQRRYSESGDVYVAWSETGKMAKVGAAKNAYNRLTTLRKQRYGGQNDWELTLIYECSEIGNVENKVHQLLKKYSIEGIVYRRKIPAESSELFKCTLRQANAALEKVVLNLR